MTTEDPKRETDWHIYRGSHIPKLLRFAWTVFIIFGAYYLAHFMWPDLKSWFN